MQPDPNTDRPIVRIEAYLDDQKEPFQTIVPPGSLELDTTKLDDGQHVLALVAYDSLGNMGRRRIRFMVQNGPGITVTGLRADERVAGRLNVEVNAFSGSEPFDPVRAESSGPIPVWTWVMMIVIFAWSAWYGLEFFMPPPTYAKTPTYEQNPVAMAQQPMQQQAPTKYTGKSSAAGFDFAATGPSLYTQNCAACHGANGAGVPGAFPPLAADPVVTAKDATPHIKIVLNGLQGKPIAGKSYSAQMPSFKQLSDADIAAIVDHERTSWGNNAPIVSPDVVKSAR